jgi:DNA-binding transcriptional regulator YhcF (GntR family)
VEKKCALSSSKVHAALKKQTAGRSAKSYRELGRKIQVHHKTVKKYLTKMEVHCKAKNPQHVNNPSKLAPSSYKPIKLSLD